MIKMNDLFCYKRIVTLSSEYGKGQQFWERVVKNYPQYFKIVHENPDLVEIRIDMSKMDRFVELASKRMSKKKGKKVGKYDKNGTLVQSYKSAKEAAKINNLQLSNLYGCIDKEDKTSRGYKWKYLK